MKKNFSRFWKASKQPRKQKKYLYNAPLHIRNKFISAHLSKELIKKYNRRSLPLKKGDTVKIMVGQFKKRTGKIERIDLKKRKVYITNIQVLKKDGTKTYLSISPSNLLIQELDLEDKERKNILDRKTQTKKVKNGQKTSVKT